MHMHMHKHMLLLEVVFFSSPPPICLEIQSQKDGKYRPLNPSVAELLPVTEHHGAMLRAQWYRSVPAFAYW